MCLTLSLFLMYQHLTICSSTTTVTSNVIQHRTPPHQVPRAHFFPTAFTPNGLATIRFWVTHDVPIMELTHTNHWNALGHSQQPGHGGGTNLVALFWCGVRMVNLAVWCRDVSSADHARVNVFETPANLPATLPVCQDRSKLGPMLGQASCGCDGLSAYTPITYL